MELMPLEQRPQANQDFVRHMENLKTAADKTPSTARMSPYQRSLARDALQELQKPAVLSDAEHSKLMEALRHRKHWKPRLSQDLSPIGQRQLEIELTERWVSRTLALLAPHMRSFPQLAVHFARKNPDIEWRDALARNRHNTLRNNYSTLRLIIKFQENTSLQLKKRYVTSLTL